MTDRSTLFGRGEGAEPAEPRRLPPGTRPGRVRLRVADLERSVDFYGDVLGLQLLERDGGAAQLGAGGAGAPLLELEEARGANPAPQRGRLGLYHFALLLPERVSLGRLIRHLGSLGARLGASDHLVSEAIYLHDPDGLGIEVYADRPRSSWRYQDGELQMDTRPLDIQDLLRAAADQPWAGMPAGTRVGHVHLHVGDLREADAFYVGGLGLDRVVWSYPGALFLAAGGYHHHLGLNTWAGPVAARPAEDDACLLEWELLVPATDELDAAAARLVAAGHAVEADGADRRVEDPWGIRLRLRAAGPDA